MDKKVTGRTSFLMQQKRAFCNSDVWDKAPNKTLSEFPAVTNVFCLFGFEARSSITVRTLQFMFSQNAILSIREQCCYGKIYIECFFSPFCFLTRFFAVLFCPRLSYFWSDNKSRSGDLACLKPCWPHTCLNAHTQAHRPTLQGK